MNTSKRKTLNIQKAARFAVVINVYLSMVITHMLPFFACNVNKNHRFVLKI